MKQKYTVTVAGSEIHLVTEEDKRELDDIVGAVDRRIREIHLHSKSCSRVDAALLLCLEYCAEKNNLQKMIKAQDAEIAQLAARAEASEHEIALLEDEIESLREALKAKNARALKKAEKASAESDAITILSHDAPVTAKVAVKKKADAAEPTAVEKILSEGETSADAPAPKKRGRRPKDPSKQNSKVRAMFDMISFDDI